MAVQTAEHTETRPAEQERARERAPEERLGESAEYECPREECDWAGFVVYHPGYVPLCPRCGAPGLLLRVLGKFDPVWAECIQTDYGEAILNSDELFDLDRVTNLRFHPRQRTVVMGAKHINGLMRKKLPKGRFVRAVREVITGGIPKVLTADKKDKVVTILHHVVADHKDEQDDYIYRIANAAVLAMRDDEKGVEDHDHVFFRNMFLESVLDLGLKRV